MLYDGQAQHRTLPMETQPSAAVGDEQRAQVTTKSVGRVANALAMSAIPVMASMV